MDTKLLLSASVSVLAAIVVSVGIAFFHGKSPDVITQNPAQQQNQHYGSLTGPDIPFQYLRWGGLGPIWNFSSPPSATTTSGVFCSFLAPAGTSTVTLATWRPDALNGFGTGQTFDISTSTIVSGSSTPALVANASFSASQIWQAEASSTVTGSSVPFVLAANPGTGVLNTFTVVSSGANPVYVNFRVATSTAGNFTTYPTGNCQVQFIQL